LTTPLALVGEVNFDKNPRLATAVGFFVRALPANKHKAND
jgi:hypothetical protein